MASPDWRTIKGLALDALEQPAAARDAWIRSATRGDDDLAAEVRSLVAASVAAEPLYESAVFDAPWVLKDIEGYDPASLIGIRLGAWRIVAELGRGGMGAAYLAERADEEFEKRAAIKLIKRGMDTDAILDRFRRERQILAHLAHPNIAALLDGGTTAEGLPYFVMEYVDGLPIDQWCDERRLGIGERLALFLDVCAAVAHAHEMRVVHRDIKPSNVLVTSRGVVKLLDFGIATVLDPEADDEPTMFARSMTLSYASPEQVHGQPLTPASDVYALGVLLYKLLAGRLPLELDGAAPAELERRIVEDEPTPPSRAVTADASTLRGAPLAAVRRQLGGDLDAIALKALRKAPQERYATPQALADDVGGHLDGRPIVARRPAWWRHVLPRRGRTTILAAACALVIAASTLAWWGVRRTESASAGLASIAVLPFDNAGPDPAGNYLADAITDQLIRGLSGAPGLRVIARDSVSRYAGDAAASARAGRELGVDVVVSGSVVERDETLTVNLRIEYPHSSRATWQGRYERPAAELQSLQADLRDGVVGGIGLDPVRTRGSVTYAADPEAYQLYLKGRYFWKRRTPVDFRKSIGYFREATTRDPRFTLALAGLADSFGLLTEYHAARAADTYPEVRRAIERGMQIDPELAELVTSRAYYLQFYEWDFPAAEREFKRAIALSPHYSTAHHWYAEFLSAMGRHDEAITQILEAERDDPLSLIVNSTHAWILYMARRYDEGARQALRVIDMDPNFPEVYDYLKRCYDQLGRYRDAIEVRQRRRALLGVDAQLTPALRAARTAVSPAAYWRARYDQELIEAKSEGLQPFNTAELLASLGDKDEALRWLDTACREHDFLSMYAAVSPMLDSLRTDPRFTATLAGGCGLSTPPR